MNQPGARDPDLSLLHPAFQSEHWNFVTPCDLEWMESLYGNVILKERLRGVDLLVPRKAQKKIASVSFELEKLDSEGQRLLEEILESVDANFLPIDGGGPLSRRLLELGFDCVQSEKTNSLVGIKTVENLQVHVSLPQPFDETSPALIELISPQLVLESAPKRSRADCEESLSKVDWFLSPDMEHLEYVRLESLNS